MSLMLMINQSEHTVIQGKVLSVTKWRDQYDIKFVSSKPLKRYLSDFDDNPISEREYHYQRKATKGTL